MPELDEILETENFASTVKLDQTRPLLVGEANPYQVARRNLALWPFPARATGNRLRLILKLSLHDYLSKFQRENLCYRVWNLEIARAKAQFIESSRKVPMVLLGAKVCRAFGLSYEPFTKCLMDVFILPHPSGRCRTWNEPGSEERARDLLKEFL